jgi:zinc-finger of transposase IS204/IS1001/IS1096/IS1165
MLMGSREMLSSVFHFPAGITIDSIDPSANELVIRIACDAPTMPCPECQQHSARIHSSYQRQVADVPCAGRNVILAAFPAQIRVWDTRLSAPDIHRAAPRAG